MGTFGSEKDVEKTFWAHVPKPNRTISLLLLRLINGPWLCIERDLGYGKGWHVAKRKKNPFFGVGEKFVRETGVVCRTRFLFHLTSGDDQVRETLSRRQVSKDYREKNASTTYVDFPDTYFCFDEVGPFPLYFLFPVWQEGGGKQNMQGIQEKGRRKWARRFRRPEKFGATSQQHRLIMSKKELRSQRQSFPLFLFPPGGFNWSKMTPQVSPSFLFDNNFSLRRKNVSGIFGWVFLRFCRGKKKLISCQRRGNLARTEAVRKMLKRTFNLLSFPLPLLGLAHGRRRRPAGREKI